MRFLFVLVLFRCLAAQAATLNEFHLSEQDWIDPYTVAFVTKLVSSKDPLPDDLEAAITDLGSKTLVMKGESFELNIQRRSLDESLVFIVTFHSKHSSRPHGVWIFSVQENPRSLTNEFLKFSAEFLKNHTGAGDAIFKLIDFLVLRIKAKSDSLEAGWLGRYFWAQDRGFEFKTDIEVFENGLAMSQIELLRNNFRRFCKFHGIDLEELSVHKSLGDLQKPSDFLKVVHKKRRKILIRPYVDHNKLGSIKSLDVGKAFVVADYRPSALQENTVLVGGEARSDRAMPPWYGIRNYSCETVLLGK